VHSKWGQGVRSSWIGTHEHRTLIGVRRRREPLGRRGNGGSADSVVPRHVRVIDGTGSADEIGTLLPGRRADIVLIKGDPARNIAEIEDVGIR
jgi:hypothetical protein